MSSRRTPHDPMRISVGRCGDGQDLGHHDLDIVRADAGRDHRDPKAAIRPGDRVELAVTALDSRCRGAARCGRSGRGRRGAGCIRPTLPAPRSMWYWRSVSGRATRGSALGKVRPRLQAPVQHGSCGNHRGVQSAASSVAPHEFGLQSPSRRRSRAPVGLLFEVARPSRRAVWRCCGRAWPVRFDREYGVGPSPPEHRNHPA